LQINDLRKNSLYHKTLTCQANTETFLKIKNEFFCKKDLAIKKKLCYNERTENEKHLIGVRKMESGMTGATSAPDVTKVTHQVNKILFKTAEVVKQQEQAILELVKEEYPEFHNFKVWTSTNSDGSVAFQISGDAINPTTSLGGDLYLNKHFEFSLNS
jgi:hypothetical protein